MKIDYFYDPHFQTIWEEQNQRIELLVINHFLDFLNHPTQKEIYTLKSIINNKKVRD